MEQLVIKKKKDFAIYDVGTCFDVVATATGWKLMHNDIMWMFCESHKDLIEEFETYYEFDVIEDETKNMFGLKTI